MYVHMTNMFELVVVPKPLLSALKLSIHFKTIPAINQNTAINCQFDRNRLNRGIVMVLLWHVTNDNFKPLHSHRKSWYQNEKKKKK